MQAIKNAHNEFDWVKEINDTILKSLVSSFGIDFILLEDKRGGDVDTIHNVRNEIYATEEEKEKYNNRGEYDSNKYHSHTTYKETNSQYAKQKENGTLVDGYTGEKVSENEKMDLDHIVSAKKIHDDRARVLAEMDGADLANKKENLISTQRSINRSKKADSMEEFVQKVPDKIVSKQEDLNNYKQKLEKLKNSNVADINEIAKLENKIKNAEKYIEEHEKFDEELALKQAARARKILDDHINRTYYTSTKFFKNTALASHNQGIKMGQRQVIGLLLTEVWFELKEAIPEIYLRCKKEFTFEWFLEDVKKSIKNIFSRISNRFKALLSMFADGYIGGVLSSVNTTILNIFLTTEKIIGKLLREIWTSLTQAAKLLFFNPNKLPLGELTREVSKLLATGISVALGAILQQKLATVFTFPFGGEIAVFIGAVASGIMTLGAIYFLEHSALMQKVWNMLNVLQNKFKSEATLALEYYQKVNAELDRYLVELAKIELNMNPDELLAFANSLGMATTEKERGEILDQEIERRNIELPFEKGNVKAWLLGKCQKK